MPMMMGITSSRIAATGGGTVLFDASGFSHETTTGTSPKTISGLVNVGSGANGTTNRTLLFGICFDDRAPGTVSNVSVTWNGVAMEAIGSFNSVSNSDMFLFGLVAPALGANDFIVSWTGSAGGVFDVGALSLVGADQTGGVTTFRNFTTNTATGTPATVTISSATGEICMAVHECTIDFSTGSGTNIGTNSTSAVSASAFNWDTGVVSRTLTYTNTSSQFASMAVSVKAA